MRLHPFSTCNSRSTLPRTSLRPSKIVCARLIDDPKSRADSYLTHAVKSGYPPRPLTLIPELPLASLGLKGGDQLTLTQKAGAPSAPFQASSPPASAPPLAPTSRAPQAAPPSVGATFSQGPYSVPLDGGYLVHRVRSSHDPHRVSRILRDVAAADSSR